MAPASAHKASCIEERTMRRVRRVHSYRRVINPFTVRVGVVVLFVGAIAPFVSFHEVVKNMPHSLNPIAHFYFHMHAFLHTAVAVKVALLGVSLVILACMRDASMVIRDFLRKKIVGNGGAGSARVSRHGAAAL